MKHLRTFILDEGLPDGPKWTGPIVGDLANYHALEKRTLGKRWLVVCRTGPLGDFTLSLPLLKDIQERYSTYNIHWIIPAVYIRYAQMAGLRGCFTDAWSLGSVRWMYDPPRTRTGEVIMFQNDINNELVNLWNSRGWIVNHWGGMRMTDSVITHARDRGYDLIHASGVNIKETFRKRRLFDELTVASPSEPITVVHPGVKNSSNAFRPRVWRRIICNLMNQRTVIMTCGPGEITKNEANYGDLVPMAELELPDLVKLLCSCSSYISGDTGTAHVAGECMCKGVVLWRDTNPTIWGPYWGSMKRLRLKQASSIDDAELAIVTEQLLKR